MNTSTELRAEAQKIAVQARELLNSITAENRSDKEAEFDRIIADADAYEARAARMDKGNAFAASYDAADGRRPSEERAVETISAEHREARAFDAYVRSGDRTELRAQNVGPAADGG